jgi:hypothetical protein
MNIIRCPPYTLEIFSKCVLYTYLTCICLAGNNEVCILRIVHTMFLYCEIVSSFWGILWNISYFNCCCWLEV